MKKLIHLFAILILVSSCGGPEEVEKISSGEISYELTYPHLQHEGFMSSFLPDEMSIIFSGTKMMTTVAQGSFFQMNIVSDEASKSIDMYLDFDTMQYACSLTAAEIDLLIDSQPIYTYEKTTESDSVAGMWSTKYNMSSEDSLQPGPAWFTEDFTLRDATWFSSYAGITGFPVVYDIERYGVMTHAVATKFSRREIKEKDFELDTEFKTVDFNRFESGVQELFDLILG